MHNRVVCFIVQSHQPKMKSAFNKTHRTEKTNTAGGVESDQFQTPEYALTMLRPYLDRTKTIWEPACGKGNIVNYFRYNGFSINGTDYLNGEQYDFFKFDLADVQGQDWNYIITNPPWSLKILWTARCLELNKPFALLVPITYLEGEGTKIVHQQGMEIIMPYQRIAFETPYDGQWRHYGDDHTKNEPDYCGYTSSVQFFKCPVCGGEDDIRVVKSVPQKKSMWITWRMNIGAPIVYYDMRNDIARWKNRHSVNEERK